MISILKKDPNQKLRFQTQFLYQDLKCKISILYCTDVRLHKMKNILLIVNKVVSRILFMFIIFFLILHYFADDLINMCRFYTSFHISQNDFLNAIEKRKLFVLSAPVENYLFLTSSFLHAISRRETFSSPCKYLIFVYYAYCLHLRFDFKIVFLSYRHHWILVFERNQDSELTFKNEFTFQIYLPW